MYTQQDLEDLIHLVEVSDLDQTIKDILIRDLQTEGLTEFLAEQIQAYCADALRKMDDQVLRAQKILEDSNTQNPA